MDQEHPSYYYKKGSLIPGLNYSSQMKDGLVLLRDIKF